jgi:predicted nucleic acid-binding protein
MGFLIDTNVLSELRKKERANLGVQQWFVNVAGEELYLSAMVIGEVRNGIERLRPRDPIAAANLERWIAKVQVDMAGQILPVTTAIADRWGRLNAPDPLSVVDSLLAATALEHDLTLVTRNVVDIQRTGVRWLNPFTD